jgi:hypothetical protein
MKHFQIIVFLCGIILVTAYSCKKENSKFSCIEGKVIGYEQYLKASLIEVKSITNMGKTIIYHDIEKKRDTTYNNVIKSPGLYPKGKIYFTYRKYNSDTDSKLFLYDSSQIAPLDIIPYDATIYVITNYSQTNCVEEK